MSIQGWHGKLYSGCSGSLHLCLVCQRLDQMFAQKDDTYFRAHGSCCCVHGYCHDKKERRKKILQRNRCQIIVHYIQRDFLFILAVLFLMLVVLCFRSFSLYLCFLDHLVVGAARLSLCCVDLCGQESKKDDAYCLVLRMLFCSFLSQFYGFQAFLVVLSGSLSHPPRLG